MNNIYAYFDSFGSLKERISAPIRANGQNVNRIYAYCESYETAESFTTATIRYEKVTSSGTQYVETANVTGKGLGLIPTNYTENKDLRWFDPTKQYYFVWFDIPPQVLAVSGTWMAVVTYRHTISQDETDSDPMGAITFMIEGGDAEIGSDITLDQYNYLLSQIQSGGGGGVGAQPKLFSPTISKAATMLYVTDDDNGSFEITYDLYSGDTKEADSTTKSFDLDQIFTSYGTYELSVKATGTNFEPSDKSNVITYKKEAGVLAKVSNLGAEDPSEIYFEISEDFPNDFEEIEVNGNVFIKFPTFYRRIDEVTDGQITAFTMATAKADDDFEPYPCFINWSTNDVLDYVLVGKYLISDSSRANSVANGTPESMRRNAARSICRAVGSGYQSLDWQFVKLISDLALITNQDVGCNSLTSLFGIEQIDYPTTIDGMCNTRGSWYIAYNPSDYREPTDSSQQPIGYESALSLEIDHSHYAVSKLGYSQSHPFANFPIDGIQNTEANLAKYYETTVLITNNSYYDCCFTLSQYDSIFEAAWGLYGIDQITDTPSHYGRLCYRPIGA